MASDHSAVELALKDAGFTYYMPVEFVAARNRLKPNVYELRRFALLKGYMFVGEMEDRDWPRLAKIPGVQGVVGSGGRPLTINPMDMFRLRMYEARSRAAAEAQARAKMQGVARLERESRKVAIRGARKKLFPGRSVRLIWGKETGREATVQAWTEQDQITVLLANLNAATETITVPYEYLKAV